LHEHDHKLAAYCATCERWAALDLERLIAEGRGDESFVGRKPRCSYCRGLGVWQLRPPVMKTGHGRPAPRLATERAQHPRGFRFKKARALCTAYRLVATIRS
jgi:hypothetical protein